MIKVLIADDHKITTDGILAFLEKETGIEVAGIAHNGRDAIGILEKQAVDIAVLDINMPVMNGEEMMDAMQQRAETSDIPVVVISTEGSSTRIERLKEKGARFIQKPFTPEIIRDTICEVTGVGEGDE